MSAISTLPFHRRTGGAVTSGGASSPHGLGRTPLFAFGPDNPATGNWGRGSRLAYDTARHNDKPVFLVTKHPPKPSAGEPILASNLFGVLDDYWVVPEGGIDDKE